MSLQLVSSIKPITLAPTEQLFCPYQLNEYARNDVFVRLPNWSELPRSMRGRVIHSRHLRRMVDYAVFLLGLRHENLKDARNLHAMGRHYNKTPAHLGHHLGNSRQLRELAKKAREQAHLLFRTVGAAEVL